MTEESTTIPEQESILLYSEEIEFEYPHPDRLRWWLNSTAEIEAHSIDFLNIIFCSDEYLLQVNQEHLDHDYYTDIITFHYHEDGAPIQSDLFISIDRVRDNAEQMQTAFADELDRVIIHGLLHMCGYGDKTPEAQSLMRSKEDEHLMARITGREIC